MNADVVSSVQTYMLVHTYVHTYIHTYIHTFILVHERLYKYTHIQQIRWNNPHVESVAPYLVKKLLAFYRTQRSVTVLTKLAIIPVLSQINPVEATR